MNEEYNKEIEIEAEEPEKEMSAMIEQSEKQAAQKKSAKSELMEWIKDILTAVVVAVLILQFVMPTIVREHSMENTLHNNDYVFVSKKSYTWFGDPQRGDIIVFQSALLTEKGTEKLLVKRIIGLPGDRIAITGGMVYVNGELLEEPYTKDGYTGTEMPELTVPEGSFFCMGDNRQNSADSRDSRIGFVSLDDIKGKVVFRVFPFSDIGGVYNK